MSTIHMRKPSPGRPKLLSKHAELRIFQMYTDETADPRPTKADLALGFGVSAATIATVLKRQGYKPRLVPKQGFATGRPPLFSEARKAEIRALYLEQLKPSIPEIAARYGCCRQTILKILQPKLRDE